MDVPRGSGAVRMLGVAVLVKIPSAALNLLKIVSTRRSWPAICSRYLTSAGSMCWAQLASPSAACKSS